MATAAKTHRIKGNNLSETPKAIKFEVLSIDGVKLDEPKTEWFPFSQISSTLTDPNKQDCDEILASAWICKTKGIV